MKNDLQIALKRLQAQLLLSSFIFILFSSSGLLIFIHRQYSRIAQISVALVRDNLVRGDVRGSIGTLERGNVEIYSEVHYRDHATGKSYFLPAEREFIKKPLLEDFIHIPVYFGPGSELAGDFEFRYSLGDFFWTLLILIACASGIWIATFRMFKNRLITNHDRALAHQKNQALSDMALQVVHDIRSPLAALKIVQRDFQALSIDTQELASHAVERIQCIANDLLKVYRPSSASGAQERFLLGRIMHQLVAEKRAEYLNYSLLKIDFEITDSCDAASILGRSDDLTRALSNLINNSIEAMQGNGQVEVRTTCSENCANIDIIDEGPGISESLHELIKTNATIRSSKANGSGLGFRGAQECIKRLGGTIQVKNVEGGTIIGIQLPTTE